MVKVFFIKILRIEGGNVYKVFILVDIKICNYYYNFWDIYLWVVVEFVWVDDFYEEWICRN